MILRKVGIWVVVCATILPTPAWTEDVPPPNAGATLFVYPANHGFLHQTGQHAPDGWSAMYRLHEPGYFIEGQTSGGELLDVGTFQYVFAFSLLPGQLGGLLSKSDDVVRIEAWDATTHECLISRTFQVSDFQTLGREYAFKTVTFSTWGRLGHRFEPRVFWPGLSGIFLHHVSLQHLRDFDPHALAAKAERFEREMGERYLDRGFVVGRRTDGRLEDVGDAAIWTGLYAASQAWRYQATRLPEALERMQASLWALHQLAVQAYEPGTLVRYVYPDFRPHPQAASKDTYTGFFFAMVHCLPSVKDKALRKALREDVARLADHFVSHDLAFVPGDRPSVDMNPALSKQKIAAAIEDLRYKDSERNRVIRVLEAIRFYFLIHAQRPWPELSNMIRHLKKEDFNAVHEELLPFINGAFRALAQLQQNVHKSAILWRWQDAPYQKLDRLLLHMLNKLPVSSHPSVLQPEELRFLASQAQHALHFLKAAGRTAAWPNPYEQVYRDNLWDQHALLKTAWEWNGVDEDLIAAVVGESQAAAMRTSSGHLSYLALFNLILTERDPTIRQSYRALFERQYRPEQADYNAMLHVMGAVIGVKPTQPGLAFWSLAIYPEDRRGIGDAYWTARFKERAARYGGEVLGKARDPLPVNERQRDAFIWQRSARSLRGDDATQYYPPLDYLFVYWMARAYRQIN